MANTVIRNCKIFLTHMRGLPWLEFCALLRKTLFFDEPILVYKREVATIAREHVPVVEGVQLGKGEPGELEMMKRTLSPLPWEFQCHEFDGVDEFFVARKGSRILHISWIYSPGLRNRLLSLQEGEAEIKFSLTLPAWRGQGVYPKILLLILDYLNTKGLKRVFICVHKDNRASIRGIEKACFTRVGEIRLRKILGVQISPRFDTSRVI